MEDGNDPGPRVSLALDAVTFLRLVTGNLNPVTAFMAGQITIQGDLMFAASVPTLFEIPTGRLDSGRTCLPPYPAPRRAASSRTVAAAESIVGSDVT